MPLCANPKVTKRYVHPDYRHKGLGMRLCVHSQEIAISNGYRGIQFNLVVSTNLGAIRLWERCGFKIIGVIPGGFHHRQKGYVDALVMFKNLL